MKYILFAFGLLYFVSCRPSKLLRGHYQQTPVIITTEKSIDNVWSSVVDFFSANGIGIKTIDRASGIIVGYSENLLPRYTYEIKDNTASKSAWVVIKKIKKLNPMRLKSDFNIRIREEQGKTQVSINMFNLTTESSKPESPQWRYMDCASTGVFEKSLADLIK